MIISLPIYTVHWSDSDPKRIKMLIVLSGNYNFLSQLKVSVILSYGTRGIYAHPSFITAHLRNGQVAKQLRGLVAGLARLWPQQADLSSSRPAWSTGQLELHRNSALKNHNQNLTKDANCHGLPISYFLSRYIGCPCVGAHSIW